MSKNCFKAQKRLSTFVKSAPLAPTSVHRQLFERADKWPPTGKVWAAPIVFARVKCVIIGRAKNINNAIHSGKVIGRESKLFVEIKTKLHLRLNSFCPKNSQPPANPTQFISNFSKSQRANSWPTHFWHLPTWQFESGVVSDTKLCKNFYFTVVPHFWSPHSWTPLALLGTINGQLLLVEAQITWVREEFLARQFGVCKI